MIRGNSSPSLPLSKDSTLPSPFSREAFEELAQEHLQPHLGPILAAMVREALGEGRNAQTAREYIINRLFGRPTEKLEQTSRQSITISLRPQGEVVEGQVRVLPAIEAQDIPEVPLLGQVATQVVDEILAKATQTDTPDRPKARARKGQSKVDRPSIRATSDSGLPFEL